MKTYIMPSRRQPVVAAKKVFSIDASAFPSLNETIPSNNNNNHSFSAAAKKIINPVPELVREVAPGWVHIRRQGGKFEYKYGLPVKKTTDLLAAERFNKCMLKYRLAREQYDIDRDVERLGDLSIYFNTPTLAEKYAELEREKLSSSDEEEEDNN
jgi:hypothetical protein